MNHYVGFLPEYIGYLQNFSKCQDELVPQLVYQTHTIVHHGRRPSNRHLEPALLHIPLLGVFVSFKRPEAIDEHIHNSNPQ